MPNDAGGPAIRLRHPADSHSLTGMTELAPAPDRLAEPPAPRRGGAAWPAGLLVGAGVGVALTWLLARVIWLPAYFGVFFFLVAGMLVGAASFRIARSERPITTGRVISGVAVIALASTAASLIWEYRYRAATIGAPPKFGDARADALQRRRPVSDVESAATAAFRTFLREQYAPGGVIGYVKWAAHDGEVRLTLPDGFSDQTVLGQRRWAWVLRTVACCALFAAGLWYQLEALRSAQPTCNVLRPGEEAEDA